MSISWEVVNMQKEHIKNVLEIANIELGKDYFNYTTLINVINNPSKYICKVALSNTSEVYGFAFGVVINNNELKDYLKLDNSKLPTYVLHSKRIGVIKTVAVNQDYKQQGIGSTIVKECYNQLIDMNIEVATSVAWKKGATINIDRVLTKMGFIKHLEVKQYWLEESQKSEFECPYCGFPCTCNAVIYFHLIQK